MSNISNSINANAQGVQYLSSSGSWSGLDGVSSNYVLTSNGTGMPPSFQAAPSGSITLNVDNSGSVSGSVLSLFASIGDGSANAGSTMAFIAATGSEIDLQTTDSGSNTLIGSNCGNASALGLGAGSNCGLGVNVLNAITTDSSHTAMGQYALSSIAASTGCTAIGSAALANATGGNFNSAFGLDALQGLLTGAYNTCLGISSGLNYEGAESSNICIVNAGVLSENNVIRIGTQGSGSGQQASCYIAGIYNNDSSGFSSPLPVYVDSSTGQLGYGSSSSGITFTGDSGTPFTASSVTIRANNSSLLCGSTVSFAASSPDLTLNITDGNENVLLGQYAGNSNIIGSFNHSVGYNSFSVLTSGNRNVNLGASGFTALLDGAFNASVGDGTFTALTSGTYNSCIGAETFESLLTGSYNCGIGGYVGVNYTTSESSNILIGYNVNGTVGESNVLRIGVSTGTGDGQLSAAYIAGIYNNDSSGFTSPLPVYVDSSTGQLGYGSANSQPSFFAYMGSSSTDATGNATDFTIPFDTVLYDNTSSFDTGTYTYTVPVTGNYLVTLCVYLTNMISTHTVQNIIVNSDSTYYSGDNYLVSNAYITTNSMSSVLLNGSILIHATSGDTFSAKALVSGGTKTVTVNAANAFFTATLV